MLIFKWRKFLIFLGDAALFYLALASALTLRHLDYVGAEFLLKHIWAFSFLLPVWVLIFYSIGYYDIRRLNKLIRLLNQTIIAFLANTAAAAFLFYLFYLQLGLTPKTHLLLTLLFFHIFALLWRRVWTKLFIPKFLVQRVAFLGANPLVEEIKRDLLDNPHFGFSLVELQALKSKYEQGNGYWRPRGRRKGGLEVKFDMLVLVAEEVEKNPVLESLLMSTTVMEGIPVITHLDFYEDLYGKIPPEHAAKLGWLLGNVLHENKKFYTYIKRGIDIVISSGGLLIVLPFMAITYAALFLEGAGRAPVFFFQKRVGYLGKRFILWKFRTMVTGAERAGPFSGSIRGDSRVTRLGRFLRKTRLDELPQLWNVLRGDMSMVGPRPEWIREVNILEHNVPHYHLRHLVKPGITGWAQINLPATASELESFEKLHYDLYYVKNISLALDLGIILRTFHRVFQHDASFLADSPRRGIISPEKREAACDGGHC